GVAAFCDAQTGVVKCVRKAAAAIGIGNGTCAGVGSAPPVSGPVRNWFSFRRGGTPSFPSFFVGWSPRMDYTLASKGLRLVPQELASKWSFDTSLCIGHGEVMVPKTANESSAVSSVRQINTAEGTYASSWDSLRSGLG